MEGSNYWRYGYKTQYSYPRLWLITWRRPEVKFGWEKQQKNYQDEDKICNKINTPSILFCFILFEFFDGSFSVGLFSNNFSYLEQRKRLSCKWLFIKWVVVWIWVLYYYHIWIVRSDRCIFCLMTAITIIVFYYW